MWPWLLSIGKWAVRLIGGWLPIGTKPVGEWLGKILWASGIFLAGMIVWTKFTQPTTKSHTTQKASEMTNIYHQEAPRAAFGCASLRVIEYYQKEKPESRSEKK